MAHLLVRTDFYSDVHFFRDHEQDFSKILLDMEKGTFQRTQRFPKNAHPIMIKILWYIQLFMLYQAMVKSGENPVLENLAKLHTVNEPLPTYSLRKL